MIGLIHQRHGFGMTSEIEWDICQTVTDGLKSVVVDTLERRGFTCVYDYRSSELDGETGLRIGV